MTDDEPTARTTVVDLDRLARYMEAEAENDRLRAENAELRKAIREQRQAIRTCLAEIGQVTKWIAERD